MIDLVYKLEGMESVKVNKDIVYNNGSENHLKMDIFYPLNYVKKENDKTVILIHGTAPMENIKNIEIFQSWGKLLAIKGFTAIAFDWRPEIESNDVADLIRFVRTHEIELELNASQIALLGFSAGVEEGIVQAMKVNTGFITNLISYYGKIDTDILNRKGDVSTPKIFIAMGAQDDVFEVDCNDAFIREGISKGWHIEKIIHSEGEHGFDAFNEGPETNLIIEKTLEFLKL